jgi:hypothetical protein
MDNKVPTLTFEPFDEEISEQGELYNEIVKKDSITTENSIFDESSMTPEENRAEIELNRIEVELKKSF